MTIQMPLEKTALYEYLREMKRTYESKCYHAAIMMALSIPDICCTLTSSKAKSRRNDYVAWVEKYIFEPAHPYAKLYYKLRCGVSHNAFYSHDDIQKMGFNRVAFTFPESKSVHHRCIAGKPNIKILFFDVTMFLDEFYDGVSNWYNDNIDNETMNANMDNVIRVRNGFPPVFVGLPILT